MESLYPLWVSRLRRRVVPERAQDKKKSLLDWRDRLGGNIGAQLRRMRVKPS